MARVVAWPGDDGPGYINVHWPNPRNPKQFFGAMFKEPYSFWQFVTEAMGHPARYPHLYFCTSTQSATRTLKTGHTVAHRSAPNALCMKAIWLDVDIKDDPKHYKTVSNAIGAIQQFVLDAGLPNASALVHSGGGIHVYWISKDPLAPDNWQSYAEGLKAEALRLGLKCDAGVTADRARILRIPGTINTKYTPPVPAKLLGMGEDYDFPTMLSKLRGAGVTVAVTPRPGFDLTGWAPPSQAWAGLSDKLGDGLKHSDLPLKADEVIKGCAHFHDAAATHGAKHGQGLWHLTALASTFLDDGKRLFRLFSKGYPKYDTTHGEADAMFERKAKERVERKLGWPGCKAFEGEGAQCKTCPFYGKIKSPLNLATPVVPPPPPPPPLPPQDPGMLLPINYFTNAEGLICETVTRTLANGAIIEENLQLFYSALRKARMTADPTTGKRSFCAETSLDKTNWGPVTIDEEDFATDQALFKAFRKNGIKPVIAHERRLREFMTSWSDKLDRAIERTRTAPFGWLFPKEGGTIPVGFAYGGKVYMSDGTEQDAGTPDRKYAHQYTPTGTADTWWELSRVVTEQHHPALEALLAVGFASPLLSFTGQSNVFMVGFSHGSGARKTTSINLSNAIWAQPIGSKLRPASTVIGAMTQAAAVKNLPLFLDEIIEVEDLAKTSKLIVALTDGGRGAVCNSDGTPRQRDDTWKFLLGVGSNHCITEHLNNPDTDATLERVYEFEVERRETFTRAPEDILILNGHLDQNYGQLGVAYAKVLGRDPKGIATFVHDTMRRFRLEIPDFKAAGRIRAACAVVLYCGAKLASDHLGVTFNLTELWDFLKQEFMRQQLMIEKAAIVAGEMQRTVDEITQFLKDMNENILVVQSLPSGTGGRPAEVSYVSGPTAAKNTKGGVQVRMAVTACTMQISRTKLQRYLDAAGINSIATLKALRKHFGATEQPRTNLAAGMGIAGSGQETVIRIFVDPNSPWVPTLFASVPRDQVPLAYRAAVIGALQDVTAAVTPSENTGLCAAPTEGPAETADSPPLSDCSQSEGSPDHSQSPLSETPPGEPKLPEPV